MWKKILKLANESTNWSLGCIQAKKKHVFLFMKKYFLFRFYNQKNVFLIFYAFLITFFSTFQTYFLLLVFWFSVLFLVVVFPFLQTHNILVLFALTKFKVHFITYEYNITTGLFLYIQNWWYIFVKYICCMQWCMSKKIQTSASLFGFDVCLSSQSTRKCLQKILKERIWWVCVIKAKKTFYIIMDALNLRFTLYFVLW